MLLLFARGRVDVHTNALCDYRQAHHQCVDDTWKYTLKWETQTVLPSFLLCLTLLDNYGKTDIKQHGRTESPAMTFFE